MQERVHRSARVWNLYLDLEESMGAVQTTKAAYERALELKVASPQMVLNFASFLEENKYFEDSFRVYEKVGGKRGWLLFIVLSSFIFLTFALKACVCAVWGRWWLVTS